MLTNTMGLQTREETEDFIHDVIALMLPYIDKSNIRPAYQKTKHNNPAGKNLITQDGVFDGLEGFKNTDDFVYFNVVDNTKSDCQVEYDNDYTASMVEKLELTVSVYGNNALKNALLIKGKIGLPNMQAYLNSHGYYQQEEGDITPLTELVNGEWWDRYDVTFNLARCVIISTAEESGVDYAKGYNGGVEPEIIVNGVLQDVK